MVDPLTRRDVLSAGAGVLGAGTLGPSFVGCVRGDSPPVTVATRNCYLGADLFRLLAAAMADGGATRGAVGDLVTTVDRSHVAKRLGAIAGELARTEPDLVGIQEAALIRTGSRNDATVSTDVRYDFRETLLSALDERDLPYRVVATAKTTDVELPANVGGERLDVRLTDRDLILARDPVTTANPVTDTFDAAFSVTRDGRTVAVERAYGAVDATVGDHRLTFCNTHLESASTETRAKQAMELRAALEARSDPVVLVGDVNSGPGASTGGYGLLTETFEDVASTAGATCCYAADLRNPDPSLDEQIDHILVRGDFRATDVTRIGADPAKRITVDGDRLWPADHAGVVATLAPESTTSTPPTTTSTPEGTSATRTTVPATSTPRTPPPSPAPTDGVTDDEAASRTTAPGFGAATAIASVVAAVLAARRRAD